MIELTDLKLVQLELSL